jgi:nucleotide-binding universal stress UspA family protein
MIKIERILCPTDFSTESQEALRYAVAVTLASEATLILLHCTKIKSANGESKGEELSVEMANRFKAALSDQIQTAALSHLKWQPLAVNDVGDIGEEIRHQAHKRRVDLIVMGSRRRPHAAALLGSTAEKVSRNAPCPVLVTHPREREWVSPTTGKIDLQRILVAHDFSTDSELALNYGLSLAQEIQAEVHLLHVLDNAGKAEPEIAWSSSSTGNAYTFVARRLQQAVPKEVFLWCNVVSAVRSGKASQEILAYAEEQRIDLICIGASGSDWGLGKLFGSNVDRVLREAPCPVLVARQIKQAEGASNNS